MKIYKIEIDIDNYDSLEIRNYYEIISEFYDKFIDKTNFGLVSIPELSNYEFWFASERRKQQGSSADRAKGNFMSFSDNEFCLCFDEKVRESELYPFLELTGTIFLFDVESKKYWLYINRCQVNCLDYRGGEPIGIAGNYLLPFGSNGEAKIIESRILQGVQLFQFYSPSSDSYVCVGNSIAPSDSFYFLYHYYGFTGLIFKEVYRSKGEADYDLEKTVSEMKKDITLEHPIFVPTQNTKQWWNPFS